MLLLLFQIGEDRYALDTANVLEVVPWVALKRVAHAPAGVAGLLDYHSAAVPVLDLRGLTTGQPSEVRFRTRLILVKTPPLAGGSGYRPPIIGLLAERATGTARVWKTTRIMLADPVRQPMRTALMPPPSLARFAPVVRTGAVPLKSPPPPPPSSAVPPPLAVPDPAPANAECDRLKEARRLADAGRLQEAAGLCETHLREQGASASAWYLLGVVRDAAGDRAKAAECYSKTLYLDPSHEDALLQRALLAEGAGDATTAARLRSRIVRVQERTRHP
jgi:chemotaxis signal transduction protein